MVPSRQPLVRMWLQGPSSSTCSHLADGYPHILIVIDASSAGCWCTSVWFDVLPHISFWHVACNVLRQLEIEGLLHALTVRLAQLIRVVIQGEALESGVTCHEQSMQA